MYPYLNNSCKSIVQFGAANGKPIDSYQQQGWSVVAYDNSIESINILKNKNITARHINLNHTKNKELAYQNDLNIDLNSETNIFAIRILEYLKPEALILLIFNMINLAKPGSTYFIMGHYKTSNCHTAYVRNYFASFFAARTDMEILLHRDEKSHQFKNKANKPPIIENDEILIIRKRAP